MYRFGNPGISSGKASLRTKIKFLLFGMLDAGCFLRSSYFKKYLSLAPLKKLLRAGRDSFRILDAGTGNGEYSFYLAERYPQAFIDACDIDENTILEDKAAQEKLQLSNISFFKTELSALAIKDKYDFIACIGVIIYMNFAVNEKILRNLYAALKKNGIMYLYLAHRNWQDSLMINPRFYSRMYEKAKQQNIGDLYNQQELSALLRGLGFKVIKEKLTGGFWGELAWEVDQVLKEKNFTKIRIALMPFLKLFCLLDIYANNKKGTGMIFVAEKP